MRVIDKKLKTAVHSSPFERAYRDFVNNLVTEAYRQAYPFFIVLFFIGIIYKQVCGFGRWWWVAVDGEELLEVVDKIIIMSDIIFVFAHILRERHVRTRTILL